MRPSHHEPSKVQTAVDIILRSAIVGGIQGCIVGIGAGLLAHRYWPTYRGLTTQFKTYIQLSFILVGGSFKTDKELMRYERRLQYQALLDQQKRLDEAADRGEYIGLDGRVHK